MQDIPRIYLEVTSKDPHDVIRIADMEVVNKLRNVLRRKVGDSVKVFNGKGIEFVTKIIAMHDKNLTLEVESIVHISHASVPKFMLAQALTQTKKLDDIIKMNTEIGVSEFVLFESDHSKLRNTDLTSQRLLRFAKIAQEASRQSERLAVPNILQITSLQQLADFPARLKIVLHSRSEGITMPFSEFQDQLTANAWESILVTVGPEGGFSARELNFFQSNGFVILNLNLPILRTETAGVAFCSFLCLFLSPAV